MDKGGGEGELYSKGGRRTKKENTFPKMFTELNRGLLDLRQCWGR